jgi:hypothetical protein
MLGYNRSRLEMLYFGMIPPDDGGGWPTFEQSMREQAVLRKAMALQLGAAMETEGTMRFPWGTAYCSYHPKDDSTSAGINYGMVS